MTTVRSRRLSSLLGRVRAASDPEMKEALTGVASEVRERLASGSKESHDFFVSVAESIQGIRGNAHSNLRAECLFDCCQYFYVSGSSLLALLPARQVVRLVEISGSRQELRRAINLLGILCADTGNLGEAIEHYSVALQIARDAADDEGEAATWTNLSTALAYMSRYQDALLCLEQTRNRAPPTEAGRSLCKKAAHNMSLCFFNLGDLQNARLSSEFSLSDIEPTSSTDLYSRVVREQHYVDALLELGEYDLARKRVDEASRYAAKANTVRAHATVKLMEGLVDAYCGDAAQGIKKLENLLILLRDIPMIGQDVLTALVRAYEKAGENEKALDCLQEVLRIHRARREEGALAHVAIAGGNSFELSYRSRQDLLELHQRQAHLKAKLAERQLAQAQIEVLERLAITADLREDESGEHGIRVGRLAALLAKEVGWNRDDCVALELAARLHDIGKVGIPDRILLSSGTLKDSERKLMLAHAAIGGELLSKSNIGQVRIAEEIARWHHEWWDGTGYPDGLSGARIPRHARIVALADVFDALTHGRTYEKPWSKVAALAQIQRLRGQQFEPELTDRFLVLVKAMIARHDDLDDYLARGAKESGVLQARCRIRTMLANVQGVGAQRTFDLASAKS